MSELELPEAATLQIHGGDGCAPGQWTAVEHATLDADAAHATLVVSLGSSLPLPARHALLDARDGAVPLDIALASEDGALLAFTANARDPLDGERSETGDAIVIEIVRLLAKIGG